MIGQRAVRTADVGEVMGWVRANRQRLAARVVDEVPDLLPGLGWAERREGDTRGECEEVVVRRIESLAIALGANAPMLFLHELGWDKARLVACGGAAHALERQLAALRRVLEMELEPSKSAAAAADALLEVAMHTFARMPVDVPSAITAANPHAPLVRAYLDALFTGDWRGAGRLILEAADGGVPVEALYLDVLQVAQRELGRLWQLNQISSADEHYGTAITRRVLVLLQPRMFESGRAGPTRLGHTLVAAAVGIEMHELAMRMVSDFFDRAGWETWFLGADTPLDGLLDTIFRRRADLVALSASLILRVPTVAEYVRAIRGRADRVIILVGGHPFEIAPRLWAYVGADGCASSAADAVRVGERLMAEREAARVH